MHAGLLDYAAAPVDEVGLVLVHSGGQKGSGLLNKLRKLAAVTEVKSVSLKPSEVSRFVESEVRSHGGRIAQDAAQLLDRADAPFRAKLLLALNCGFGQMDCATLERQAIDARPGWVNSPRRKSGVGRRAPLWPETVAALAAVRPALVPGAVLCAYLPTTVQIQQLVLALPAAGFHHLETFEVLKRAWHVTGRSVRPDHRMVGHTGFLTLARVGAPG